MRHRERLGTWQSSSRGRGVLDGVADMVRKGQTGARKEGDIDLPCYVAAMLSASTR